MTLPVTYSMQHQMVETAVNDEMEKLWKEASGGGLI